MIYTKLPIIRFVFINRGNHVSSYAGGFFCYLLVHEISYVTLSNLV